MNSAFMCKRSNTAGMTLGVEVPVNGSPVALRICSTSGNTVIGNCQYGDQVEIFLI